MLVSKIVSVLVIISQGALAASPAFAAPATPTVTPEAMLLENVIALRGAKLSQAQQQARLQDAIRSYVASAPAQGREERLSQAMIDLGVYTPEQVRSFAEEAQAASAISSGVAQTQDQLMSEVTRLASLRPMGAEFSATCDVVPYVIGSSLIIGSLLVVAGFFVGEGACETSPSTGYALVNGVETQVTNLNPTNCTGGNENAAMRFFYTGAGLVSVGMITALVGWALTPANTDCED